MRLEIQLPTALVGYVRVELRRREIGMSEHFLNRSQICSSLEEVGRKRVPEEVRVHPEGVETRFFGHPIGKDLSNQSALMNGLLPVFNRFMNITHPRAFIIRGRKDPLIQIKGT